MLRSYYSVDGVAANLLSTIAITKVVSNSLCGAHGNIRTYNLLHLTFLAYSLTLCRAMTLTSLFRAVPKEADNVVQGSIPIHMQQQHSRARFSSPDMHRENSCPFYPPPLAPRAIALSVCIRMSSHLLLEYRAGVQWSCYDSGNLRFRNRNHRWIQRARVGADSRLEPAP